MTTLRTQEIETTTPQDVSPSYSTSTRAGTDAQTVQQQEAPERVPAIIILSGGLDSTVCAYYAQEQGYDLHALAFDYGQRHGTELLYAEATAQRLGARFTRVDLHSIAALLPGSALTDKDVSVPEGHYAADSMRATVVPNRNAIMLSIAGAVAVAEQAQALFLGIHAGDHFQYPDTRPEFISAMAATLYTGNEGFLHPAFRLIPPFIYSTKAEIVRVGAVLGVPFAETWSCYAGGDLHCGLCGTCVERRLAFEEADLSDPTVYANPLPDAYRTAPTL